jgi:hypothetical protein
MRTDLVRRAVRLATGETLDQDRAEALAELLGVREELLAHLVLRRDAFAASPKVRKALAEAARKRPPRRVDRQTTLEDATRIAARNADLTQRLKAVIDVESREAATLLGAERALRERVLASPPAAYDAHLRIRIPD